MAEPSLSPTAKIEEDAEKGNDEKTSSHVDDGLENIRRQLLDPSLVSQYCATHDIDFDDFPLSTIPWTLTNIQDGSIMSYPDAHYLLLRKQQELSFCQQCLEEGVRYFKKGKFRKAKESYILGLGVMPDHVELLVAYGLLETCRLNLDSARTILSQALRLQPQHKNAQRYLKDVDSYERELNRHVAYTDRASTAMQDASLERALQQEDTNDGKRTKKKRKKSHREGSASEDSSRKRRKRSHRKHRKKRRHDCSDDDSCREHRRHKKRHKRKRIELNTPPSNEDVSPDTVDSLIVTRERRASLGL